MFRPEYSGEGCEVVQVPVSGGKGFTIVDPGDATKVLEHTWCFNKVARGKRYVHRRLPVSEGAKLVKLHRWLLGVTDRGVCVDHINGDSLDNRRANLRICNQGENMRNYRRAWGKNGIRGVMKTPAGKFRSRIRYRGKLYHIGTFDTLNDASIAYAFASELMHGEFGSLPGHEAFLSSHRINGD